MGASSDLGQPFRPRQKSWGLGWEESSLSRYDFHAEGALLPSITDGESKKIGLLDIQCFS